MHIQKWFVAAALMLSLSMGLSAIGETSKTPPGETSNIFGVDAREPVTSTEYPWSTIGYTSTGCTGTLVARNLVLTAAHCVLDGNTGKISPNIQTFYPNMIDYNSKTTSHIERVWWGTGAPDSNRAYDWAILKLEDPLGDTYGWMGVQSDPFAVRVTTAGYSSDYNSGHTATVHRGCNIQDKVGGLLLHDCHTTRGSSGGPMFYMKGDDAYLIGINVAEGRNNGELSLNPAYYTAQYANFGVPSATFLPKVKELKGE